MLFRFAAYCLAAIGVAVSVAVNTSVDVSVRAPFPVDRLGLHERHTDVAGEVVASPFRISGATEADSVANRSKNIRLWVPAAKALDGKYPPNYPQETGDCVSFGLKNLAEYYTAAEIGEGIAPAPERTWYRIFPPHIYGGSRVTIGKGRLGSSPGSVGVWAAQWAVDYGILPVDHPDIGGVPEYKGSLADSWGYRGVPQSFIKASEPFRFASMAQIKSAQDGCDALANGYPFTIASNFGTNSIVVQDGRRVAKWNASWPHQMCVIGYDGTAPSGEDYFYVLNSWGEHAHPKPLQGEPPGGFWVTWSDLDRIAKQGDSWALSGFSGFPAREFDVDFSVVGASSPTGGGEMLYGLTEDWVVPANLLALMLFVAGVAIYKVRHPKWPASVACTLLLLSPMVVSAQDIDFTVVAGKASAAPSFHAVSGKSPGVVVTVYSAPNCSPCIAMFKDVGNGDSELPINWEKGDVSAFPAHVRQIDRYPLITIADKSLGKTWIEVGYHKLDALKTKIKEHQARETGSRKK